MAGAGAGADRRSYDTDASADAQGNIQAVIGRLEEVIAARDRQVKAAMADFTADGVADEYHAKELRWNRASREVRNIIALVRSTLEHNDTTAQSTMAKAKAAVDGIG
ncbi:pore-forming ESAT-6 family protein [Streptomyces sp. NPDC047022]|uniref:pore-forming ESAT-6 family protein n=1 Tax=Streptomyces sp. NPDC047022 TaxID=3155737 RepID=UPI0033FBF411